MVTGGEEIIDIAPPPATGCNPILFTISSSLGDTLVVPKSACAALSIFSLASYGAFPLIFSSFSSGICILPHHPIERRTDKLELNNIFLHCPAFLHYAFDLSSWILHNLRFSSKVVSLTSRRQVYDLQAWALSCAEW